MSFNSSQIKKFAPSKRLKAICFIVSKGLLIRPHDKSKHQIRNEDSDWLLLKFKIRTRINSSISIVNTVHWTPSETAQQNETNTFLWVSQIQTIYYEQSEPQDQWWFGFQTLESNCHFENETVLQSWPNPIRPLLALTISVKSSHGSLCRWVVVLWIRSPESGAWCNLWNATCDKHALFTLQSLVQLINYPNISESLNNDRVKVCWVLKHRPNGALGERLIGC